MFPGRSASHQHMSRHGDLLAQVDHPPPDYFSRHIVLTRAIAVASSRGDKGRAQRVLGAHERAQGEGAVEGRGD